MANLHAQLAAFGIVCLAFIIVGANAFQDMRFGGGNFPFLKQDVVFVDDIVESRQNSLVNVTLVVVHACRHVAMILC